MLRVQVGLVDQVFVLLVYDTCDVGHVHSCVALPSNMERYVVILRKALEEHLKERINILRGVSGGRDCLSVVGVRIAHIDWLVKEDYVGVVYPAVGIDGCVFAIKCNAARSLFEEEVGSCAAAWPTIEPENEGCV